jgi:hypothetical protein
MSSLIRKGTRACLRKFGGYFISMCVCPRSSVSFLFISHRRAIGIWSGGVPETEFRLYFRPLGCFCPDLFLRVSSVHTLDRNPSTLTHSQVSVHLGHTLSCVARRRSRHCNFSHSPLQSPPPQRLSRSRDGQLHRKRFYHDHRFGARWRRRR